MTNKVTILVIFFVGSLIDSSGSKPAQSIGETFRNGVELTYALRSDAYIKDFKTGKPIAYRVAGTVKAASVWGIENTKLLKFKLTSPELHVRPHKSESQTEFGFHKSPLDRYKNDEFYALWTSGKISSVFVSDKEEESLVNLKKAIVSLFQYQILDGDYQEDDVSGECDVTYTSTSPTSYRKVKRNCQTGNDTSYFTRSDMPLSVSVNSHHTAELVLVNDGSLDSVESRDYHQLTLAANKNVGGSVDCIIKLKSDGSIGKVAVLDVKSVTEAVETLKELKEQSLRTSVLEEKATQTIKDIVKERADDLAKEQLGTLHSAYALVDILPIARLASKEQFVQILKARSFQENRAQLLDIFGAVQSIDCHNAVKEVIGITSEKDVDGIERYLQASAVATRPNYEVLADLLKIAKSKVSNDKVRQTLIQAIGSMAFRYARLPNETYNSEIVQDVEKYLTTSLKKCPNVICREPFLRGLQTLQSVETIEQLLEYVDDNEITVSVTAMKALKSFPKRVWTPTHRHRFEDIFFQKNQRYDSSVRTLAIDILLDLNPSVAQLKKLLEFLKSKDKAYEVKKYLLEKIKMLSENCEEFNKKFVKIFSEDPLLNNYHIHGTKGLTTALSRKFSKSPSFNATLLSVQEIYSGILKRGVVDMTVDAENQKYSVFTLELYAAGLSSFAGSKNEEDEDDDAPQQPATAGMEITVQGSHLRPLEFFKGQTELMGHVWSGTASEPTPAYTATTLLHDHEEVIRLQNGATISLNVLGAASIDLNGKVKLSLWSQNAHCQVDKNTGIVVSGRILVNAGFVSLDSQFNASQEPKLNLITDIDFSGEHVLCMQLSQPETVLTHTIQKSQKIPEVGHNVNTLVNYRYSLPGFTHALNQKNNDMCNKIFD